MVFLVLIVRYVQFALQSTERTPLSLLFLAIGIALLAIALYLTARHVPPGKEPS